MQPKHAKTFLLFGSESSLLIMENVLDLKIKFMFPILPLVWEVEAFFFSSTFLSFEIKANW